MRHNPVLKGQTPGSLDWDDEHAFDSYNESRMIEEAVEAQHKEYKKSKVVKSQKASQKKLDSESEEKLLPDTNLLTSNVPKIITNDFDF